MFDITYCANSCCPFEDCDRHLHNLKNVEDKSRMISMANLDSTCRRYIAHVLDEIVNGPSVSESKTSVKICEDCINHGWDMPQCRECDFVNNFMYFIKR